MFPEYVEKVYIEYDDFNDDNKKDLENINHILNPEKPKNSNILLTKMKIESENTLKKEDALSIITDGSSIKRIIKSVNIPINLPNSDNKKYPLVNKNEKRTDEQKLATEKSSNSKNLLNHIEESEKILSVWKENCEIVNNLKDDKAKTDSNTKYANNTFKNKSTSPFKMNLMKNVKEMKDENNKNSNNLLS